MRERKQNMQSRPTSAASRAQIQKRGGQHGAAKGSISSETVREEAQGNPRPSEKPRTDKDEPRRDTKRRRERKAETIPARIERSPGPDHE